MTDVERATRKVSFLIVGDSSRIGDLFDSLEGTIRPTVARNLRHGHEELVWEVRREGTGATDLSALIADVLAEIRSLADAIRHVVDATGATTVLRVVQYIGDDPVGPGMAVEADDVKLLAGLGAFLDIDQYQDLASDPAPTHG